MASYACTFDCPGAREVSACSSICANMPVLHTLLPLSLLYSLIARGINHTALCAGGAAGILQLRGGCAAAEHPKRNPRPLQNLRARV